MLARSRQSGFDSSPITLIDMAVMIALNPTVRVYEPLDLIEIWQELDAEMLKFWREKRANDEKRKAELEEKSSKAVGS